MIRRALIVGCLGVLGLAFVFLAFPESVPTVPLAYGVISIFGLVSLVMGGWMVRQAWRNDLSQDVPPVFEYQQSVPTPGADMDQMLFQLERLGKGTIEYRDQIRQRLVEAAIEMIRLTEDCSRAEAIELLESKEWTDDSVAASYFAGQALPAPTFGERIQNWFDDETAYERRIRRSVEAIAELGNFEQVVPDEDDGGSVIDSIGRAFERLGFSRQVAGTSEQLVDWDGDEVVYDYGDTEEYQTGRWVGISAIAFVAIGVSLFSFQPALLVAGSLGLLYAGYARSASAPNLDAIEVERIVSDESPEPGDEIEVTVRVRNGGSSVLPDLRLVDAVPAPMRVVGGSPRVGVALRPGKTTSFTYTASVARGEHKWPLYVIGRDVSGNIEARTTIEVSTTVTALPRLTTTKEMTVRDLTTLFSGRINTEIGGSGVEFHIEREYQPGDPVNRIDWKRHARTGELATLEFREERSANVVLMFEARQKAYLAPSHDQQHAVDRAVHAANDIFAALFGRGDQVGIAAFDSIPCWLGPNSTDEHLERSRQLLGTNPALSSIPPTDGKLDSGYVDPLTHIRRQLGSHSQILLFSPLGDDYPAEVARRLDSSGHLVTVISPNPTVNRTIGQQLANVERQIRVNDLRKRNIRVVDWPYDQPFGLALETAKERW